MEENKNKKVEREHPQTIANRKMSERKVAQIIADRESGKEAEKEKRAMEMLIKLRSLPRTMTINKNNNQ